MSHVHLIPLGIYIPREYYREYREFTSFILQFSGGTQDTPVMMKKFWKFQEPLTCG